MFQTNVLLELNCTNLAQVFKMLFSCIGHCGKEENHFDTSINTETAATVLQKTCMRHNFVDPIPLGHDSASQGDQFPTF
jgi:hypothetical protein